MRRILLVALSVVALGTIAWAGAPAWKAPASAKSLKSPAAQPDALKVGRALFEENCVICHGKAGKGDGEAAAAMSPKPKSLVLPDVQAQSDGELFWKISEGREAMPSWKALSERERWSLVHFIRALAGKR
jgi:mono/diheme cytochrome c family protein